jgi:hypothetical protein
MFIQVKINVTELNLWELGKQSVGLEKYVFSWNVVINISFLIYLSHEKITYKNKKTIKCMSSVQGKRREHNYFKKE